MSNRASGLTDAQIQVRNERSSPSKIYRPIPKDMLKKAREKNREERLRREEEER
jgi:hypothetical protein